MLLAHTALWTAGGILALLAVVLFLRRQRAAGIGAALAAAGSIVLALAPHAERPAAPTSPAPQAAPQVHAIVPDSTAPSADTSSTSLVLGTVVLKVAPSDHYALSVDGRQFLMLDTRSANGMVASCSVGDAQNGIAARLLRNRPIGAPGRLLRPDDHTLLVQDQGVDLMRIRLVNPRRIEVHGRFFPLGRGTPVVVSDEGVQWPGGAAKAGRTIDLRRFGAGTIDFRSNGRIRVRPRPSA